MTEIQCNTNLNIHQVFNLNTNIILLKILQLTKFL